MPNDKWGGYINLVKRNYISSVAEQSDHNSYEGLETIFHISFCSNFNKCMKWCQLWTDITKNFSAYNFMNHFKQWLHELFFWKHAESKARYLSLPFWNFFVKELKQVNF